MARGLYLFGYIVICQFDEMRRARPGEILDMINVVQQEGLYACSGRVYFCRSFTLISC